MNGRRLLDANLNRLAEGLRVVEDLLRFHYVRPNERDAVRALRTELASRTEGLALTALADRDVGRDPGRPARYDRTHRTDTSSVLWANLKRSQQAARVLEEVARLEFREYRGFFKRLRFRLYELEAALASLGRRFDPTLYVILDEKWVDPRRYRSLAAGLKRCGATVVQVRSAASTPTREILRRGRAVRRELGPVPLIINNRADVAASLGGGVHVGQGDLPAQAARRIIGPDAFLGVSVTTVRQARAAEKAGADYVAVGAVFRSSTKPECRVVGLEPLRAVKRTATIPVVAIGGITEENVAAVVRAGADGVAVAQAVFGGKDPGRNLARLRRAIERARRGPR